MKKAKNLSRAERLEIGILLEKSHSLRSIARVLGRSPNTLSYEVRRNQTRGRYQPLQAHAKARIRKRLRRLQWSKIEQTPPLKRLIIEKLEQQWNPDEIAGWLRRNHRPDVSKTTIYDWLRSQRGARYCPLLYSQRYCVRPRRPKAKRSLIPNRIDISRRFRGAETRNRYGHWEKDALVSRLGITASLAVAQERKSRLLAARKVKSLSPIDHEAATGELLSDKKALSLTRDNGIENTRHEDTPVPSFFCRPYASWQKGGIENANKLLRRHFPKGTNFRLVSQQKIDRAVAVINNKPRKILGYRSALEVASAAGIIKSRGVLIEG